VPNELRAGAEIAVQLKRTPPVTVTFNLNWHPYDTTYEATDLDIGCLYRCGDGHVGAIQAVRPVGGGAAASDREVSAGTISLDRDDRDGSTPDGETLTFREPGAIEFAIVFASIYRGVSDFRRVGAALTIGFTGRESAVMYLANPDPGLRWCAMLACGIQGREFVVVPQERYFLSGLHADRHYGFGLDWVVGLKEPNGTGAR
jgi:tellurite resistance protein TerA